MEDVNRAFNDRLRRQARRLPAEPEPELEPVTEPIDLGAGPRASVSPTDPNREMNAWIRGRWSRSRQQSETIGR
jgi:hypothetical protein